MMEVSNSSSHSSTSSTMGRIDLGDNPPSSKRKSILSSSEDSSFKRARIPHTESVICQVLAIFPSLRPSHALAEIDKFKHRHYSEEKLLQVVINNILNKAQCTAPSNHPSSSSVVQPNKQPPPPPGAVLKAKEEDNGDDEDLYGEWSIYRLRDDFPLLKTSFLKFAFEIHGKSFTVAYSAVHKACKKRKSSEKQPLTQGNEAKQLGTSNLSDWENAVLGMKWRKQPKIPGNKPSKFCLRFEREWTVVRKGISQGTSKQGQFLLSSRNRAIQSDSQDNTLRGMASVKSAFGSANGNASSNLERQTKISFSGHGTLARQKLVLPAVPQSIQANSASVPKNAQKVLDKDNGIISSFPTIQPNTRANHFSSSAHVNLNFHNIQLHSNLESSSTRNAKGKQRISDPQFLIPPTLAIPTSGAPGPPWLNRFSGKNAESSSKLKIAEEDPGLQLLLSSENLTRKSFFPSETFNGVENEDENHFRLAESQFYRMANRNDCKVVKVELIINKKLQEQYDKAKAEFGSKATEKLVFHGTDNDAIERIIVEGFRIGGEGVQVRNGMACGPGVYTALTPDISVHFCKGENMLLLSLALVGTCGEDYTQGRTPDIYVFKNKDYLLPRYIVHFRSTKRTAMKEK